MLTQELPQQSMHTTQLKRGYVTPDSVATMRNLQRANYDDVAGYVKVTQYLIDENQKQYG